ncbi:hypothetical protein L6R52_26770 [Myxococcota bacterium]|nr:hypothetical protein [Myxococcota bacterium]
MRGLRLFTLALAGLAVSTAPSVASAQGAKLFVTTPLPIILGEVEDISVVIELPDTPETEGRPLQIAANVGRVEAPERVAPGKYRVKYRVPPTKFPQAAILAVWHETGPDAPVDFLRIPLSARTRIPAKAAPGAEVRVLIGDDAFGPVVADRSGNAMVPVVMPPGAREVIVESAERGGRKTTTLPVKVPPYNRLAMAVTPYLLNPDGKVHVSVHVYHDDANPPAPERIQVSVPNGELKLESSQRGYYRYKFTPAVWKNERELAIYATVSGDETSSARATIMLGNPVPERLVSRTPPTSLPADGASTKIIRVLALDHYGLGVRLQQVRAATTDGQVGAVRETGGGHYEVVLTAPSELPKAKKLTVTLSLTPPVGATLTLPVDVTVHAPTGGAPIAVEQPVGPSTSGPGASFGIGARVGGSYDAQLGPMVGVELSVRPAIADGRLAFFVAAEYRKIANDFTTPDSLELRSSVERVPMLVGLTYDFAASDAWRGYLGLAGGVAGIAHTIEADFQATQIFRRLAPVGEIFAGASYAGVFLEVGTAFMSISDKSLEVPPIGFQGALGYRLGLF